MPAKPAARAVDDTYSILKDTLRARGKNAGIVFKGFGWHTLRRTYATFRDMIGAPQAQSPELVRDMGHSSASMTAHYLQRDEDVTSRLQELVYFSGSFSEEVKPN